MYRLLRQATYIATTLSSKIIQMRLLTQRHMAADAVPHGCMTQCLMAAETVPHGRSSAPHTQQMNAVVHSEVIAGLDLVVSRGCMLSCPKSETMLVSPVQVSHS